MTLEFVERNLLVDEQCVQCWYCDHERVSPDGFGNDAVTNFGCAVSGN